MPLRISESGRRVVEGVKDLTRRENKNKYHSLKRYVVKRYPEVKMNVFKIIGRTYKDNKWKRKVPEILLIKQYRPKLNVEEQSIP